MKLKLNIGTFVALFLTKLGNKLTVKTKFKVATACYKIAVVLDPKWIDAYLKLAEVFVNQRRYKDAAETYKRAITIKPTISTVHYLGFKLAKQGKLDDEFYKSILDVIEHNEIRSMMKALVKAPILYHPSKLWLYFMVFNTFQIEAAGIENFKRTVNQNYFNWTANGDIAKQSEVLNNELGWSESDLEEIRKSMGKVNAGKPSEFTDVEWKKYTQLLLMLWEIAIRKDKLKLLNWLEEPMIGNPIQVEYKGHRVTQDLCNSVIEINAVMEAINFDTEKTLRVAELGAGYGRIANVLLQIIKKIQVVIIDIPPALYVSQWYLSKLFANHFVFKYRDFSSYQEIKQEFEHSSVAFLSPAQIEYLPEQMFDLFINISSLHEMTNAQIEMWFNHIDRTCKGWFYSKQYIESRNDFDGIVVRQNDYPVKTHWKELFNRTCPVQGEFFEALYKVN